MPYLGHTDTEIMYYLLKIQIYLCVLYFIWQHYSRMNFWNIELYV